MTRRAKLTSADVRAKLSHPVIDSDGHVVEIQPVLREYIAQVAGPRVANRFERLMTTGGGPWGWYAQTWKQRRARRTLRPPFWTIPARNATDRATAMLPTLMRKRLDSFGIDFAVIYTTLGLPFVGFAEDEMRRSVCRALNVMYADNFAGHQDRLTPAAVVPMFTPAEAIEEAEFAVRELGFKTVMIAGNVKRPVPIVERGAPKYARYATWIDSLALDSPHDYDPVWAKFIELKVAPASHSNSMGWGARATTTNYMYNHIGHFAASGEAFAKALFFGGVTQRFPDLNVAFLEGGAAWAANLYNDIVEHWEKRNIRALRRNLDPALVDRKRAAGLFERYGGTVSKGLAKLALRPGAYLMGMVEDADVLDDFAACGIQRAEDIRERFVPTFYYGCEADDRMTAVAFDRRLNHFGAKLNAMFSSDIGHWDVTDMKGVVAQSYGLVQNGLLSQRDYRAFMFANAARLHGGMNPNFFVGTAVEAAAAKLLRGVPPKTARHVASAA